MYYLFCYAGFKNGILKQDIDNQSWEDTGILAKQFKIEQEDQIIQIAEQEEGKGSGADAMAQQLKSI